MGLEVQRDEVFQRREHRAQLVGRACIGLLVLAAALGLFGTGPLSWDEARSEDGDLTLAYERFARRGAPLELTVTLDPVLAEDGYWELAVERAYLEGMDVRGITPEPSEHIIQGGDVLLRWPSAGGSAPLVVTFSLEGDTLGSLAGALQSRGRSLSFSHFLYP